ncbi:hypothetical protein AAHH78_42565, partial [Burkholderia pseudomallei]
RRAWLAQPAHARASALHPHHRVACRAIDWEAPRDLARLLAEAAPNVVIHAASLHSIGEIPRGEDAWAAEIRASGYC